MTIQPAKMNWWYDSVIDWMILNPHCNLKQCARHFDVSPVWIYTLSKSDVFKAALTKRRVEHAGQISVDVIGKAGALADMAMDHLLEKFAEADEDTSKALPLKFVRDTAEFALQALGYGAKHHSTAPTQQVSVQVNVVSPELLAEARARLREVQQNGYTPEPALPYVENESPILELAVAAEAGGGEAAIDDTPLREPEKLSLSTIF